MKISTEKSPYSKTVVFGAAKTGKTRMVGRLAQHYRLDYIDGENGSSTFLSKENLLPEYLENINLFRLPDDGDNGLMFTSLYRMLTTPKTTICDEHGKAECDFCIKAKLPSTEFSIVEKNPARIVVIDSLTQLTTSCLAYVTRGKPDDYKYQLDDWGKMKSYMERMFSVIQLAQCNIIAITHEEVAEFEDGKKRIVPVAGSSKFAVTTSKYFDTVVYTEQRGGSFVASSGPGKVPNVLTGSRLNVKTEEVNKLYSPLQLIYNKGIV
jgi:hypothetical protein